MWKITFAFFFWICFSFAFFHYYFFFNVMLTSRSALFSYLVVLNTYLFISCARIIYSDSWFNACSVCVYMYDSIDWLIGTKTLSYGNAGFFFYWFAPWLFAMRCLYRTVFFVLFLFRLHDSRIQGCKAWCYCNQTRYIFNAHRSFKSFVWGNNPFIRLELHPKWAILDAQWVMGFVQVLIIWFHSSHASTHTLIPKLSMWHSNKLLILA